MTRENHEIIVVMMARTSIRDNKMSKNLETMEEAHSDRISAFQTYIVAK